MKINIFKNVRIGLLIGGLLFLRSGEVFAQHRFLSLGYSHPNCVGVQYLDVKGKFFVEINGGVKDDDSLKTNLYGVKGNYYFSLPPILSQKDFNRSNKRATFIGIDARYIATKDNVGKATGFLIRPNVGAEYFLARNFSIGAEIGPIYVSLTDEKTGIRESLLTPAIGSFFVRLRIL